MIQRDRLIGYDLYYSIMVYMVQYVVYMVQYMVHMVQYMVCMAQYMVYMVQYMLYGTVYVRFIKNTFCVSLIVTNLNNLTFDV